MPGSERGPELASVVPWYLDPTSKEEKCYSKRGTSHMRFKPGTGRLKYTKDALMSFAGEEGFSGSITEMGGFIML